MLESKVEAPMLRNARNIGSRSMDMSQSRTIKLARVLCIMFMMTTHAWPGSERVLAADVPLPLHAFYVIVIDSFGRASVPLLSIISGLLIFFSLEKSKSGFVILGKIQTLIVPMALWSLPIVVIMFLEPFVKGSLAPSVSLIGWINLFFSITESPANGPLHFFRDIFIMSIYSVVIFWFWRLNRVIATSVALGIVLLEQIPGGFLLFRTQIAPMYVFGFMLAAWGNANWQPSWKISSVSLVFYGLFQFLGTPHLAELGIVTQRFWEIAPRFAMAMVMWRISATLLNFDALAYRLERLEPHIFVIFCSHMIVIKFVSLVAFFSGWSEASYFYPLLLIGQIALFMIVGAIASCAVRPFPLLRGKKLNFTNPAVAGQGGNQQKGAR